jgi:hypothetical protein
MGLENSGMALASKAHHETHLLFQHIEFFGHSITLERHVVPNFSLTQLF